MKKLISIILLAIGISFFTSNVYAMSGMCGMGSTSEAQTTEESKVIAVNNKQCPITGETIQEKSKVQYTSEGKIYDFCCSMCIDEFKKDPEKYIEKIEKEKQTESKKETTSGSKTSGGAHQGQHN